MSTESLAISRSAERLLRMLPPTMVIRHDVVDGKVVGADVLDGALKPTTLRIDHPRFICSLNELLGTGRVIHVSDGVERGAAECGRIDRVFVIVRVT